MFRRITRFFNFLRLKIQNDMAGKDEGLDPIPPSIHEVKDILADIFSECSDFELREFKLGDLWDGRFLICSIDGLVDKRMI
ncbi:MAG: hypothetical protein UMV23_04410, partial [Halanaerobium sp.]|nr:hypothetical protein [Halanaerobium sp.]